MSNLDWSDIERRYDVQAVERDAEQAEERAAGLTAAVAAVDDAEVTAIARAVGLLPDESA